MPVWSAGEARGTGAWPLTGRDAAREAILQALGADPAGGIVITGPAGVGRTRLAREALALAERGGRSIRWAGAAAAVGRVPLGALAHLLPAVDTATDGLRLLHGASRALAGEGPGGAPVLCIDDVHLLDELSITLVHHLAAQRAVPLVLTVCAGNGITDPVTALWKDGLATRIELQPLHCADTARLVADVLDGEVESRTVERLWRLSRGNPLYLRELLEDGLRTGQLQPSVGLWRWEGPMVPSQRLTELVLGQLGPMDAAEWQALEVLATAEPLPVQQVIELSSAGAIASLERRGLITDDGVDRAGAGRAGAVRAAHPLYSQVIRNCVPEAALGVVRQRLAAETRCAAPEDLLRRCVVMVDSGVPSPDPQLFVDGSRRALAMSDPSCAERLAQAAVQAGGGTGAQLALIEAVYWQGRSRTSERLAEKVASASATDGERARASVIRAFALFCGLGRAAEGTAVLQEAAVVVQGAEGRALLTAADALLAFLGGDPQRAVRRGASVLDDPEQGGAARALAAAAVAAGSAMTGQTAQALAAVRAGWAAMEAAPEAGELILVRLVLTQAEILALLLSGRIRELEQQAAEWHRRNLDVPEWAGDAVAGLGRGWAALAAGRPAVAVRWFTEALAGFDRADPTGSGPLCAALLATARAMVGDTRGSAELLASPARTHHSAITIFGPFADLARVWLAAAERRTLEAGRLALKAAAFAADRGQCGMEVLLLHAALRFGCAAEVVDRLHELAEKLDSPFIAQVSMQATATVTQSGALLDEVSSSFEEVGALLWAVDTAAQAAAVHHRRGERREAATATATAVALAREAGLAHTPALGVVAPLLTTREEEVAELASRGFSNLAIAERLVVSVRTVEAHLAHVYTKLGISGRAELTMALRPGAKTGSNRAMFGGACT